MFRASKPGGGRAKVRDDGRRGSVCAKWRRAATGQAPVALLAATLTALPWWAPRRAGAQAPPILEYRFNEGAGTQALNSGSLANGGGGEQGHLSLLDQSNAPTAQLWGAPGSGVSGRPDDRALSLLSASRMGGGTGAAGPYGDAGDLNALEALSSFTLSGWFRTPAGVPAGNQAVLIGDQAGSAGFLLTVLDGTMQMRVNATPVASGTSARLRATDEWVFFAATFDGSRGSQSVIRFFVGGVEAPVQEIGGPKSISPGVTGANTNNLRVGNGAAGSTNGNSRPLQGLMDNVRVQGTTTSGGAGALDLAALEALRLSDVVAVPEPGTVSLCALPLAAVLLGRRRRRRRLTAGRG